MERVNPINARLLRIGKIVGMHYKNEEPTNTVVIYGVGAPIPPDNGNLPDASVILEKAVDIYVPDYLGYGRSDGRFTPMNCIRTFTKLYSAFRDGCIASNAAENTTYPLQYDRVLCIGRSLGGTYAPLLPKFNPEIRELAIFCPAVDNKSLGGIQGEETNEDFFRSVRGDGYYHLYRGLLSQRWVDHFEHRDGMAPVDNVECLRNSKLFIAHGLKDRVIHYSRSVDYYRQIVQRFPDKTANFKLALYPDGDHGKSTTNLAARDFLNWIGI